MFAAHLLSMQAVWSGGCLHQSGVNWPGGPDILFQASGIICSFIRLFVCWFAHAFIHSIIHSFFHAFMQPVVLSGMNPMSNSQNCACQQSLVDRRDECYA